MRFRTAGLSLAALAVAVLGLQRAHARNPGHAPPPLPPPAGKDAPGLPPLPDGSPRNASYTIDARLDPETHTIDGSLVLDWRNTSDQALSSFPFHLYWNAFRNNLSTSARGEGRRAAGERMLDERSFGWTSVKGVKRLGEPDEDLLPTLRYLNEDGNADDRTVMQVETAAPVPPGGSARFRIEWQARIPHGSVGRSGWVHDYHFIVQWFPKIGVFWKGQWNAHPFYAWTEFFSDFGVYDVTLRLPRGFVVGATGRLESQASDKGIGAERDSLPRSGGGGAGGAAQHPKPRLGAKRDSLPRSGGGGAGGAAQHPLQEDLESYRFVQEDVHDFAWTASRRFLDRRTRFEETGYPPVDIRLLLQPEHAHLAERYLEATKIALRTYGTWSAPYPYAQITVVDPAWGSGSGGMEYPTLFTGGATVLAPEPLQSPESVTIHEAGHQFWYGLVANNEFEEAWLDEGFNTYMTTKAAYHSLGPEAWGRRFFEADFGRGARTGWPFVAPGVWMARGSEYLPALRRGGEADVMARKAWTYRNAASYTLNSYGKPALVMQTLEGLLGEETMVRVLRTYARRYRFAHPTTQDFLATVDEVTGGGWRHYFDETFFSGNLCDYAVEVKSEPARKPAGYIEGKDGAVAYQAPSREKRRGPHAGPYESQVTVVRHGEVTLPVELRVEFRDGRVVNERWHGRERWYRFSYTGAEVVRAVVDPQNRIAIDVEPSNNEWVEDERPAVRAATKWAARYLLWLQNLLELHTVVG